MKVAQEADATRVLDRTWDEARLGEEGASEDTSDDKESGDDAIHKRLGGHVAPIGTLWAK
jgi:hypothetical protein